TYGKVYKVINKKDGSQAAVKVLRFSSFDVYEEIEFFGMFYKADELSRGQLWLVLELCNGGSVTDLIKGLLMRGKRLEEPIISCILYGALLGPQHLHNHRIIHRDVKGNNILLTTDGGVKPVDFGVSAQLTSAHLCRNTSVGTPFWMASEVIACEQQYDHLYDACCDVWSLGITATELADGDPPLAEMHPVKALFKIPRTPSPTLRHPAHWCRSFCLFTAQCLIKDFKMHLLEHPFIKQTHGKDTSRRQQLTVLVHEHEWINTCKTLIIESCPDDDLVNLEVLDEEIIITHLQRRYQELQIYTYVGDILIALNPFQNLNIYSPQFSKLYHGMKCSTNPPHIFATADAAYQSTVTLSKDQCIIISGESGAGKTEIVQHLTFLAKNRALREKILQVNPLVAAFGNACTAINDNSSCFRKYGAVMGAKISQSIFWRNQELREATEKLPHILYHQDNLKKNRLPNKTAPRYIDWVHGKVMQDIISSKLCKEQFDAIQNCFRIVGFTEEEVNSVYRILSAILNTGNFEFTSPSSHHQSPFPMFFCLYLLCPVASLLSIGSEELQEALTDHWTSWIVNHVNALLSAESGMNIQFYFNQHIFALEQVEYQSEGVDASLVEYEDNRPILDMFLQKPMVSDNLRNKYFWTPKRVELCFGIQHYSGKVLYNVSGFLENNQDALPADIVVVLRISENKLLQQRFSSPLTKTGTTIIQHYHVSCSCHVCGVASVTSLQALCFNKELVMVQLQYTGILETVNIRRQGYSHRILIQEFVNRHYYLAFRAHQMPEGSRENDIVILQRAKLGKAKYYHVEQLNLMLRVVLMQAYTKGWLGARLYRREGERERERERETQQWSDYHTVRPNPYEMCISLWRPMVKLHHRSPRRRGQQPKLLNSPEDSLYYNHLNRSLDYQGSKRKPRKLG
uniref:Myosin IIIB n=1 Tax=Cyprinus carpio carpio TaxID=630221 RepID=A0A9J7XNZ5_CYPCA